MLHFFYIEEAGAKGLLKCTLVPLKGENYFMAEIALGRPARIRSPRKGFD